MLVADKPGSAAVALAPVRPACCAGQPTSGKPALQDRLTHLNDVGVCCRQGHADATQHTCWRRTAACHPEEKSTPKVANTGTLSIALHHIKTWATKMQDAVKHTCGDEDCRLPLEAKSTPMVANTNTPVSTRAPAATPRLSNLHTPLMVRLDRHLPSGFSGLSAEPDKGCGFMQCNCRQLTAHLQTMAWRHSCRPYP